MNAVVKTEQKSVLISMADRYGMEPAAFEQTLRATVIKGKCTREEFAAFLLVAKEYKLNPLLNEIYAYPKKEGGIQPVVGVDGRLKMANNHPQFDGFEFEDHVNEDGELIAVTCVMYRKDRTHPTTAIEYMAECKRNTPSWNQWPRRMLHHKAASQAARYAFGFSGVVEDDEYERQLEAEPAKRPMKVVQSRSNKQLPPIAARYAEENDHASDQERPEDQAGDEPEVREGEGNEDISRQPEQGHDQGRGQDPKGKGETLIVALPAMITTIVIETFFFGLGVL